jgi:hypothetical protein
MVFVRKTSNEFEKYYNKKTQRKSMNGQAKIYPQN